MYDNTMGDTSTRIDKNQLGLDTDRKNETPNYKTPCKNINYLQYASLPV